MRKVTIKRTKITPENEPIFKRVQPWKKLTKR